MVSKRLRTLVIVTHLLALLFVTHALAGEAQLSWDGSTTNTDGSPLTTLAGYAIYYWTGDSEVAEIVDAGNQTTYTLTGLTAGETYTIAVTAYDTAGHESGYSNTITVTIEADNQAPVAVNDTASTPAGYSITIAVLANDTDPDGDPLHITIVTPGKAGDITYDATTVVYTPDATFSGTDSFSYSIADWWGATATATVTVAVTSDSGPKGKSKGNGSCKWWRRSC